jgi:methionyl-tRNA synthetase
LRILLGVSVEPGWDLPWGHGVRPGSYVKEGNLFPKRTSEDDVTAEAK